MIDAVLVVAEVGGAQPRRAVGLEDRGPSSRRRATARVDGAGLVQRVLVEVDVEVDAEVVQRLADLGEHQVDAARAERLVGLVERQGARVGLAGGEGVGDDLLRDLGDVVAAVAVLGRRLAQRPRQQRAGEAVDLRAVVVEVVLAAHGGAGRLEHPREAVADRRPAHAADVQRARRVGGDELEVERDAGERLVLPVLGALLDDRARQLAGGGRVEPDVEEAGTGDLDRRDALGLREPAGELLGERARVGAGLLGQLHRHVGGPVAVVALPGSLEVHGRGDRGGVEGERSVVDGVHEGGPEGLGELGGSHRRRVPSRWERLCSGLPVSAQHRRPAGEPARRRAAAPTRPSSTRNGSRHEPVATCSDPIADGADDREPVAEPLHHPGQRDGDRGRARPQADEREHDRERPRPDPEQHHPHRRPVRGRQHQPEEADHPARGEADDQRVRVAHPGGEDRGDERRRQPEDREDREPPPARRRRPGRRRPGSPAATRTARTCRWCWRRTRAPAPRPAASATRSGSPAPRPGPGPPVGPLRGARRRSVAQVRARRHGLRDHDHPRHHGGEPEDRPHPDRPPPARRPAPPAARPAAAPRCSRTSPPSTTR